VDKKANDTFAFDLENRLDDFFSDSLPSQEEVPADEPQAPDADLPLKDLKSTVLAIDWEITDDALEAFVYQVDDLKAQFESDKVVSTLLKLLKSLGKYIRGHKSKAHPDTIKRIMAAYSVLERSVSDPDLGQGEKEKLLLEEVRQFQLLKSKITEAKSPYLAAGQPKPAEAAQAPDIQMVVKAVEDLKSMMAAELAGIREKIDQLLKP
jgi:hypothetical protein